MKHEIVAQKKKKFSPRELTPKQEKFCQAIRSGNNYSDAYREAYGVKKNKPETINRNAYTLFQNNKIKTRIAELRRLVEEKICYTAQQSFDKLSEIQKMALENKKDLRSAIRAEELKGKLNGLYIDEVKHSGGMVVLNFDIEDKKS